MATATTTDPNAVTWNPDGTFNKGGKTFRNTMMTPHDYYFQMQARQRGGAPLNPQDQQLYDQLRRYNFQRGPGSPDYENTHVNPQNLQNYQVEIPNYKGSTAATPPTTPTTPTVDPTKPTTPVVDPRKTAIDKYIKAGGGELARLLKNKGITKDTYGITQDFNRLLAGAGSKIPTGKNFNAADVGGYYNYEDLFNKAYTTAGERGRNTAQQQLNKVAPTGFESKYFADTADDPILNEILSQQSGELKTNLQRQLERGQIGQGAYDYALNQLGNLSAGAMSTLQGIGGGVLSGYRTGLSDLEKQFQQGVTNYTIGNNPNPGGNYWQNQINAQVGADTGAMRGDIVKALGGTQLFDPNALVSKAGSVTGPSNQPTVGSNPQGTGALLAEDERRTTGTTGSF